VIDENAPQNDFLLRFNSDNDFRFVDSIYRDMYGGIDFLNNTSRLTLPSSVMAATGRRISNELACAIVPQEFSLRAPDRSLFTAVEPGDTGQGMTETIRELHRRMLGDLDPTDEDIAPTLALYAQVLSDGQASLAGARAVAALPPHCTAGPITEDPTYGIRAWMAVVSYLALDPTFLFQW